MHVTLFLAAMSLGAPAPKDPPTEANDIVGEWVVESIRANGKARSLGDEPLHYHFTADGKWTMSRRDRKVGGDGRRFAFDPKANPATIDLDPNPGGENNQVIPGIYKVERDTLTVCLAQTSRATRPTSFEATDGSGTVLYVFKRMKPKE